MKIKKLSVAVSTALVLAYLPVHAEDEGLGGGPELKLRGFGTFGVVRNTNSKADFLDNLSQPKGAGYSHKWDFGVDSKLAVQADGKFNDKLSASWQVMSQRQTDDTYRPETEMAFIKLQATNEISLRGGRLPASLFMVSDYRKVGYVNPWIRQPNEVYFQVPWNSVDGGDINYQLGVGDFTANITFEAGTPRRSKVQNEGDINTAFGDRMMGLNLVGEYGPLTVRVGYSQAKLTYTGESLARLYNGIGTVAAQGNNVSANTIGAGKFQYNKGLPGMVYNTVYSSGVNSVINSAAFQSQLAAQQATFPNMSTESLTSLILNSGNPAINAGLAQAAGAADIAAGTYYKATTTPGATTLTDAALKAQAGEMWDDYAAEKAHSSFAGFGFTYDPGTVLIQGEYTKRKSDSFVADSTGWYLTTGYHFGKFMPYVSFSQLLVDSSLDAPKLIDRAGQGALAAAGASCLGTYGAALGTSASAVCFAGYGVTNSLSEGVDKTVKATSYGQKNISLGLRWDAFKSAAIKFQYDRINMDGLPRGTPNNYLHELTTSTGAQTGSTTLLGTADNYKDPTDPTSVLTGGAAPGKTAVTEFDKSKPLNVFSLAIDFVF